MASDDLPRFTRAEVSAIVRKRLAAVKMPDAVMRELILDLSDRVDAIERKMREQERA